MRPEAIYPQKFGSGIPNPIGPATFRGVGGEIRPQNIPENWGPLVTKKLQFNTDIALFNQDQWNEIKSTVEKKEEEDKSRKEAHERSKEITQGWAHSKEHKKRQALIKLMREKNEKEAKIEQLSKHEMELDLKRKQEVIEETEKLLRFATDGYKEIHRGMMLSEVLKERDIAKQLAEEKLKKEKIHEEQEVNLFLQRIEREKEKEIVQQRKRKEFEKEWATKRDNQIEENKRNKAKAFQEDVEDYHRRIEHMEDEIKKEKKLQEIEKLESETKRKNQLCDIAQKRDKMRKDQREDEEAFTKMYNIQDLHAERKKNHQKLHLARQDRIAERQNQACNRYAKTLSEVQDHTDERNRDFNDKLDRKLFEENLAKTNKEMSKRLQEKSNFEEALREKKLRKQKEREALLHERELHAQKLIDVHDEVKKRKEKSAAAQDKLNAFWKHQKTELEDKRRSQIEEDKHRLNVTLKGYNEEDDKLEKYIQNLLLTEKEKDLNVYPIMKAKQSLELGRGVPLIAADGSKIRLNPKPKDMFYRTQDARDRLSINWNVADEKPLKVNVNDKSQDTRQACLYKAEMPPQ